MLSQAITKGQIVDRAEVLLLILTLFFTLVLMLPLYHFLRVGWAAKRSDVMDGLSDEARFIYFKMFCRECAPKDAKAASALLERKYNQYYGRKLYTWPAILLMISGLIAGYTCISSAIEIPSSIDKSLVILRVPPLGLSALAGAYMWVVNDLIWRARRLDLAPSDVHWGVLRMAIAIPLGCSFASLFPDSLSTGLKYFVAFSMGAFPLGELIKLMNRLTTDKLQAKEQVSVNNDDIIKLQGVNTEIAQRLANEDITTITQIAYCDPIRLSMRSNLSFNAVTDLMNQALAWTYLADGMDTIRKFGLRGAVEIKHLFDATNSADLPAKKKAMGVVDDVVAALGFQKQTNGTLLTAMDEIARDPFTDYLFSIWEEPIK